MADSPLNNSWPSFSKLWMKRWSFKRGSECKPCSREYSSVSGTGCVSPSSLSPPSIAEDVFFSSTTEEKDDSSGDTDFEDRALDIDGSIEDLLSLEPSLRGTEYFRDLGLQVPEASSLPRGLQSCHTPKLLPEPTSSSCPGSLSPAEPAAGMQEGKAVDTRESGAGAPPAAVSATAQGDPEFLEAEEPESFPILVRSMSTSRRHSWEVPVSPVDLGRRFSLDTTAMDSDGDREEDGSPETSQDQRKLSFVYPDCPTGEDEDEAGKRSRSKSVVLIAEKVSTARMSRSWEVSLQGPRAEERSTEENEPSHEEQSRMLMVQQVLQELKQYHGAKQRPGRGEGKEASESVTWYEFLSNENEDEEERTEKVRGATVKRRLSSLKNRVTGSFQKDKGKNREKEQQKEREKEREKEKEPKEKRRASSGHQFVPGTFSSCATCTLCSKTLVRKNGLQCLNCAVNVHKSCKNLLAECSSSKAKAKDSQYMSTGSVQNTVQYFNQASAPLREQHRSGLAAPDGSSGSARGAGMTLSQRGNTSQATASSAANHTNGPGSIAGEMDEPDALSRTKVPADDSVSLAPSAAESIIVEDGHYAALRAELEVESQDLEAESWSLAVDPQYLKKHSKDAIKRQDVIYELIQTEIHHVRTLKIMLRVYVRGMRETLQMDERKVEKIFPCVENLLDIHRHFLARLKDRRKEGLQPGSDRNYSIHSIGDVLTSEVRLDSFVQLSHLTEALNRTCFCFSVEILQALLSSGVKSASQPSGESQGSYGLPRRADTFGGYDSSPTILNKSGSIKKTYSGSDRPRERSQRASSDPQLKEICCRESLEQSADEPSESSWTPIWNSCFPEAEFFDRVLMLSQRLYSLQAIVSHQDSCIELQRASLPERDRPGRARGNVLLEQEKQRNFEKQREELAHFQKLQGQLRQEQRRWERERESQRLRAEEEEARLRRREEEGRRLQAQLEQQREELEQQRLKYQQDLERLRESAQAVEREKERLEQQQKRFKKHKTIANPPLSILDLRPVRATKNVSFYSAHEQCLFFTHIVCCLDHLSCKSLESADGGAEFCSVSPFIARQRIAQAALGPLAKTEVPIHLISTTNQLHKQAGVQQQIPTKLALSKGKEKGSKGKASHRTDSSAATDRKQILPLKLSGKEEGTLKGRRSVSPNQNYQQEPLSPPDNFSDGHPAGIPKQNSHSSLQTIPSSSTVSEDVAKEDVIFF
nr:PREDICTED: rho guanine nucleotide exchange factor 18-like [Lepisosteus oculatus]